MNLGKELEAACFCLIENCFYDDAVAGSNRPSDIYIKALNTPTPQFHQKSFKETLWKDVSLRLDQPYLLVHQGGCEHHFVITQISHENTPTLRSSNLLRMRRRTCKICDTYAATKLLINDKLMPENPTAVCEACFDGFHPQSEEGYDDYEVLPYFHDL